MWLTFERRHRVKVDFLWRGERLVVETDGHRFHRTQRNRGSGDTRRDVLLRLAGFEPVRVHAAGRWRPTRSG